MGRPSIYKIDADGRECSICKEYKTWEHYREIPTGPHGHYPQCIPCKRNYDKLAKQGKRNSSELRKEEPGSKIPLPTERPEVIYMNTFLLRRK